jgi:hypothetical protein
MRKMINGRKQISMPMIKMQTNIGHDNNLFSATSKAITKYTINKMTVAIT